jgi:hypothetical protein
LSEHFLAAAFNQGKAERSSIVFLARADFGSPV